MCKLAEDMHQARKEFASDKQNLMDELVSIIILYYYVCLMTVCGSRAI